MSMQQQQQLTEEPITEEAVAAYLQENPDFFEKHQKLLINLRVPHPSGDAVSLIERQVASLREQNRQLRRKMMELVHAARDNASTHERVHRLTLSLLEADSYGDVMVTATEVLRNDFFADIVAFWMFTPFDEQAASVGTHFIEPDDQALLPFATFFNDRRPLCGRLRADQLGLLFAEQQSEIGSAVLIPLGSIKPLGMLAIGSFRDDRFHPGMGTLVLGQIGELITSALSVHLD